MRDTDVRTAMRAKLNGEHIGDVDTRVVEEMGIWSGSVRIDIAVINGELCGYELKSARDNLNRLPLQMDLYGQVFDRLTIVTAENHLRGAVSTIPKWWGVIVAESEADGTVSLEECRATVRNPQPNALQIARLLWRDEALCLLEKHGLAKGMKSKAAGALAARLSADLPIEVLSFGVREALKQRPDWLR
jgi:hypothetical protein